MLALTGDIESAPEIKKMLTSPDREVRIAAFKAAVLLHIPLSKESLSVGLKDESWSVRAQAAIAGGKIGDTSIIDELATCLGDSNWWVRSNAGTALAALGLPGQKKLELVYRESEDPFARDMAARTLTSDPSYEFVPESKKDAAEPSKQKRETTSQKKQTETD
jgi:HEAT repeat protein